MKKLLAVLLTVLMVLGLAACSNTNNEEPGDDTPSTTYKVGLGVSTSVSASSATEDSTGKVQSTDTYALVVLDAEGKIVKVDIDAAQNAAVVTATGEVTGEAIPTKTERKEDYNMKGTSPIGKEWYEQTAAFEEYCVGKTLEEVAAMELDSENHNGPVDLATSCTIDVTAFLDAIAKAGANAVEVENYATSGLASVTTVEGGTATEDKAATATITTTIAAVALDADGKVVYVDVDASQQKGTATTTGEVTGEAIPTKTERKEDYNMKGVSPIGKEWYEQAAAYEEFLLGKTVADVEGMELDTENHSGPVDLTSSCTMSVVDFNTAVVSAMNSAN